MTWSLGVEEQFYAVIPLMMVLLSRIRSTWMLPCIFAASIASFIVAWGALGTYPGFVFYMLPARAWELGAGVALAVVEIRKDRRRLPTPYAQILSTAGLVLMIMPMALLRAGSPFPGRRCFAHGGGHDIDHCNPG